MDHEGSARSDQTPLAGIMLDCGACPYLPDKRFHAFQLIEGQLSTRRYRALLDHGFRRSGAHCYRPMCRNCNECRPIRVNVATFKPRKDQRRCLARNTDLTVTWQPRGCDTERLVLYQRYQSSIHDEDNDAHPERFLVDDGGVDGGELHARDATGQLVAVSVLDRFADALSSVYCYYTPDEPRRSLGTFMILQELDHAAHWSLDWLYLGYLIRDCKKMRYKGRFTPHQILEEEGWIEHESQSRHES